MDDTSAVADFYDGRQVFITGGTGFMGKVLVEKLLRSCPKISTIYLIMRKKKSDNISKRMEKLLSYALFDNIRKNDPETLKKIVPMEGDMSLPGLGLSPIDTQTLIDNVTVIFHLAASVRFDESLKDAIVMNLLGTVSLVKLCREFKNVSALVHISTAYSNCDKDEIEEVIYDSKVNCLDVIKIVDMLDESMVELITEKLKGNHPNTYTFTKYLAEQYLRDEAKFLPISIVRPSIVVAALNEPIAGWIDNFNGPTGIFVGIGMGVLRVLPIDSSKSINMIPVDIPINLSIIAAWHQAQKKHDTIPIFNCVSEAKNLTSWKTFHSIGMCNLTADVCFNDPIRYPGVIFAGNKILFKFLSFFNHWIPAYIYDTIAAIKREKQVMIKLTHKMHSMLETLQFFYSNDWKFHSPNVDKLWRNLSVIDQQTFNIKLDNLIWTNYVKNYTIGIKQYLLKDETRLLSQNTRKLNRLWWAEFAIRAIFFAILWWILCRFNPTVRNFNATGMSSLGRMINYLPLHKSIIDPD